MNRRDRGRDGEDAAWEYLRRRGYRLRERNLRTRLGEIDLVVERGETIVFVEVRSRRGARFGTAFESVGPRKRERIARLAAQYLARERLEGRRARFDVVAVEWQDAGPNVDHLENAFEVPE
ncbi:MAG: YraN family protein [Deltaproteobacteria bacterium]|nr:YraN family protein [Deltaproteobacteria bacterium]